jgi:hypothetical protein
MGCGGKKQRLGGPVLLSFRALGITPIAPRGQRQSAVQVTSVIAASQPVVTFIACDAVALTHLRLTRCRLTRRAFTSWRMCLLQVELSMTNLRNWNRDFNRGREARLESPRQTGQGWYRCSARPWRSSASPRRLAQNPVRHCVRACRNNGIASGPAATTALRQGPVATTRHLRSLCRRSLAFGKGWRSTRCVEFPACSTES